MMSDLVVLSELLNVLEGKKKKSGWLCDNQYMDSVKVSKSLDNYIQYRSLLQHTNIL
jgi:hypothetical protein